MSFPYCAIRSLSFTRVSTNDTIKTWERRVSDSEDMPNVPVFQISSEPHMTAKSDSNQGIEVCIDRECCMVMSKLTFRGILKYVLIERTHL